MFLLTFTQRSSPTSFRDDRSLAGIKLDRRMQVLREVKEARPKFGQLYCA